MKFEKASWMVALIAAACFSAAAQTSIKVNVNVPFNFVVGDQYLPAGHYRVTQVFDNSQTIWRIASDDNKVIAAMTTDSASSRIVNHRRSLVFQQAGGKYVLTTIWLSDHSGRQIPGTAEQTLEARSGKNVEIAAE